MQSTGKATIGILTRNASNVLHVRWDTKTQATLMQLPLPLLEFVWNTFGPQVRMCTEYIRDQYTFRCHPAYQSDNPIFDWMNVKFIVEHPNTKSKRR